MSEFIVTATALNVRRRPGTGHPILTRVLQGDRVRGLELSPDGRWRRVRVALRDGALQGWVSTKYIAAADVAEPTPLAKWLEIAKGEIGVAEYPGPDDNPRIVEYLRSTTYPNPVDEVHWCSAFVNFCIGQAGLKGTRSAAARSWLDWGVPLSKPQPGCITVFKRGTSPTSGHVAFYVGARGAFLDVLGGNQSNQVKVSPYPGANRLAYRWPAGVPVGG